MALNALDPVSRTDVVSTVGGREVIDVDELVELLNVLVASINRIQSMWNELSDKLSELTT